MLKHNSKSGGKSDRKGLKMLALKESKIKAGLKNRKKHNLNRLEGQVF